MGENKEVGQGNAASCSDTTTGEGRRFNRGNSGSREQSGNSGEGKNTTTTTNELYKKVEKNDNVEPKKVSIQLPSGESVKPDEKKQRKKLNKRKQADDTQIKALLAGVSSIVSSKPELSFLKLEDKEIEMISQPLANILDKLEITTQMNEKSDYIALFIALGTIFIPRIIFVCEINKMKKQQQQSKQKHIQKKEGEIKDEGKIENTMRNNDSENAPDVTINGTLANELLSPTMP